MQTNHRRSFLALHTYKYLYKAIRIRGFLARVQNARRCCRCWGIGGTRVRGTLQIRSLLLSQTLDSLEVIRPTTKEQPNDESEETKDRGEDLNNEDLDETVGMLVILKHEIVPVSK